MPISEFKMTIHRTHLRVLKILMTRLSDIEYPWCITGSLGLALQGVDFPINDIDLQSTKQGVHEIQARLERYLIEPVTLKESQNIRSFFGRCEIEGVVVELMGDIEKKQIDGLWEDPPDLISLIRTIEHKDLILPILDLEYEAQAYELLGRLEKSRKIKEAISGKAYC